jgi:hypothetical protein
MNRYRAVLVDPGAITQERPIQIFGNDRREIDRWAGEVLRKAVSSEAAVKVYETAEREIGLIVKPREPVSTGEPKAAGGTV